MQRKQFFEGQQLDMEVSSAAAAPRWLHLHPLLLRTPCKRPSIRVQLIGVVVVCICRGCVALRVSMCDQIASQ